MAGNLVATSLSATSVAIAFEDYGTNRQGVLFTCGVQDSSAALSCVRRGEFTQGPIHHEAGSLAIAPLEEDSKVVLAWRQGSAPYKGQVQWVSVELEDNGIAHTIEVEVAFLAVVALSSERIVYAYTDAQRNHEAVIVQCAVENEALNCGVRLVFDAGPVRSITLAALGDGSPAPPFFPGLTKVVVAYEVGDGFDRFTNLRACTFVEEPAALHCDPRSVTRALPLTSDGVAVLGLSASVFVLAYADRSQTCPTPSQSRRRALHVCSLEDKHPSIGRVKVCRATFTGIDVNWPQLDCGPDAVVLDDGYGTKLAQLARGPADGVFLAAYACAGCDDEGPQGRARRCEVSHAADGASFPWELACGTVSFANNFSTLGVAAAAVGSGYAVAYDDYGGQSFGSVRYFV